MYMIEYHANTNRVHIIIGQTMEFTRLSLKIFEKTSKNKMRVPDAVKIHSTSMLRCIEKYGDRISHKIPQTQLSDIIDHIKKSDRWIDVMNNSRMKGCKHINSTNHQHIFELLSYASYFHKWKNSVHPDNFVPESTYEDIIMTCLGVVLTTRTYLPMWSCDGYGGETIVQRRHGTDDMENLFCKSRGGNANANSKDTNHNVSGNISGCMNSIALSKRANGVRGNTFSNKELDTGKIKRVKLEYS